MDDLQIDTVNPYDPPEKQVLEQKLEDDTHLEQQTHTTLQQEQHLADSAQAAGYPHPQTDARIHDLEYSEQVMAGHIVQDHQAIDHWDHDHPDGGYADASAAGGSDDTTSDPSSGDATADDGDGGDDG